jgi:hypothetical protein
MKLFRWAGLLAAPALFLCSAADAQTPLELSLWSPVQIAGQEASVKGLRLSLFYGKNADVSGIDFGLVTRTTGTQVGWQWGFVHINDGDFSGLQEGFFNKVSGDFYGWQAGVICITDGRFDGFQSGIVNLIRSGTPRGFFPIVNWSF